MGLHPYVFKNSATKAVEYADAARTIASGIFGGLASYGVKKATSPPTKPPAGLITYTPSDAGSRPWAKWAQYGGAVLAAGAAAGTAYYKRDDLGSSYNWAADHMKYIKNLWDEDTLRNRIENIINTEKELGVLFRV